MILIAEFAAVFQAAHQFNASAGWFEHTTVVIEKLEELSSLIKDMERGERGFLLTGRQDYIGPYREAVAKTPDTLRSLRRATMDNPREQRRIDALSSLLTQKMAEMKELVELRESGHIVDALGVMQTDKGLRAMGSIRVLIGEIRDEEHALLQGRISMARNAGRRAFGIMVAGSILLLALITISAVLIRKGNHRCARLLEVTQQEISERERAEEAQMQSEETLRLAHQVARIGIFELDIHSGVIKWGAEVEAMHGLASGSFAGVQEAWEPLIHPEDRPGIARYLQQAPEKGGFEGEWRVIWPNGEVRWLAGTARLLKNKAGTSSRLVGVNIDITERKRSEQAILEMNQVLEQQVAVRTADLVSSNQELESVNKELEAFSYSVSHDLRAPLRHLDGFAELLRKNYYDQLGAAGKRYLDKITSSAKKMGRLIDDLLLFSRFSRVEVARTQVNLQQLEQEARLAVEPDTAGRKVVWLSGELPEVVGDRPMLRQVFINLLSNAVKYTRHCPEARIEIGCRAELADTGWVTVFVRDNGVGFEMEYVDKLFQVFQRLHSEEFEGTGVGLANVRRIVERHGGHVWAEGVVDQGATFYFSLPNANGSTKSGAKG